MRPGIIARRTRGKGGGILSFQVLWNHRGVSGNSTAGELGLATRQQTAGRDVPKPLVLLR
jgi:hypothetical protein